jgi:micrococcal nuclease
MRARLLVLLAIALAGCASSAAPPSSLESGAGQPPSTVGTVAPGDSSEAPRATQATVAEVVDGDTIALADGRHVRLVQIDAPEEDGEPECYGAEAGRVLARLLPVGTRVGLVADPRLDRVDRFGRLLRYVYRGPRNLNLALVARGAATVWFFQGDRGRFASRLLRAQRRARAAGRGLWGACPGTPLDPLHGADTGPVRAAAAAGGSAACPGAIPWGAAAAHAGERATVRGPVVGTHFAASANGQPTFLNVGRDYPDPSRFQVLVWGRDRDRFPAPPERLYDGRTICVTGRIALYRGVAEMELSSPEQLAVP